MRKRKYKDGTYGYTNLPYESIPDNYDIKSCLMKIRARNPADSSAG